MFLDIPPTSKIFYSIFYHTKVKDKTLMWVISRTP